MISDRQSTTSEVQLGYYAHYHPFREHRNQNMSSNTRMMISNATKEKIRKMLSEENILCEAWAQNLV